MSTHPSPGAFYKDMKLVERPLWREAFVGIEWLTLRASPVFYGLGIPRGDGSAVIAVPGFMANDVYLQEMYYWLKRIGYKPYRSKIGWNADCLNVLVNRLLETVNHAAKDTGKKVHLIGHSLGGILARSAAVQRQDIVASVIVLGSPFRGIRSHPLVMATADQVRAHIRSNHKDQPDCYTGFCSCNAVTSMQSDFPESIRQSAIYTKSDGVVDWRYCVSDDEEMNFEVQGTHIGLAFNHDVYRLIARRLAGK